MSLRGEFEKTKTYLRYAEAFSIYHTNLGGYHFGLDNSCCFYLNGAWFMFQELNNK